MVTADSLGEYAVWGGQDQVTGGNNNSGAGTGDDVGADTIDTDESPPEGSLGDNVTGGNQGGGGSDDPADSIMSDTDDTVEQDNSP